MYTFIIDNAFMCMRVTDGQSELNETRISVIYTNNTYMLSLRNANAGDFSVYSIVWPLTRKSARIAAHNYHSIKDIGDNVCDNAA